TEPHCLINPEILSSEGTTNSEEGCLSVPEFYDYIDRAAKIKVRALDRDGKPFELEAEGLLAVCIQHEMDHLEGKLFVDYLSELKRERLKKKAVKKAKRSGTEGSRADEPKSVPVSSPAPVPRRARERFRNDSFRRDSAVRGPDTRSARRIGRRRESRVDAARPPRRPGPPGP